MKVLKLLNVANTFDFNQWVAAWLTATATVNFLLTVTHMLSFSLSWPHMLLVCVCVCVCVCVKRDDRVRVHLLPEYCYCRNSALKGFQIFRMHVYWKICVCVHFQSKCICKQLWIKTRNEVNKCALLNCFHPVYHCSWTHILCTSWHVILYLSTRKYFYIIHTQPSLQCLTVCVYFCVCDAVNVCIYGSRWEGSRFPLWLGASSPDLQQRHHM